MWSSSTSESCDGSRCHYRLERDSTPLGFLEVVELWRDDAEFRAWFTRLLQASPYPAFRWETPPLTRASARQAFEFVLLDSPWLAGPADPVDFAGYFAGLPAGAVATFANLGGDAILVAPGPDRPAADYGHLAAWLRSSPASQQHALWMALADAVLGRLGERPLWLSTAGGGVPWLHIRIDDRPKYYGHAAYR